MLERDEIIHILNHDQSRQTVDNATTWVGKSPIRFKLLIQLMSGHSDNTIRNRAAWAISYIVEEHPEWIKPYWGIFVKELVNDCTSGPVKRNITRLLQDIDIPKRYQGEIIDRCFELMNNPKEEVAIRAFSMTVIGNLLTSYPELANELRIGIEELLPHASAGLKNRAGKILQRIELLK
jgi:hypothetical protein